MNNLNLLFDSQSMTLSEGRPSLSEVPVGDKTVIWVGVATFAWSMLFVWQGLDFTDMGFWLTGYQQFYTHPETLDHLFVCWLSSFIGHWVGLALGGSVLAYKLGDVVVVTSLAIITYQLLAFQLGRSRILAAMVLLTVFFARVKYGNWIGYYDLTALFYLAGAALLFFGLVGDRRLLVILAGIVLGANLFVRLPNLLGITLVSAVWLQAWAYRWPLRKVSIVSIGFLGGFALGVALVWGLIVLNGHEAMYFKSIGALFALAGDPNSHHAGSGLLRGFITDHVKALLAASILMVFGGWIAKWASKQKILLASVVILTAALGLFYVNYVREYWFYSVIGLCYVVLLSIVVLEFRSNTSLALMAFIAEMVLLLVPLGGNIGIVNSTYGIWLALPLTLMWLLRSPDLALSFGFKVNSAGFESKGNCSMSMEARAFRGFAITVILALLFQSFASAWRYTFGDSNNRFAMVHSIAHPLLVGTYTTAARAKVVAELLEAMSHLTKPGDEVLALNQILTIYFLTETHPWLGISWVDFESTQRIVALIRQKEQSGAKLPYIVRATSSTWADSWPIAAQPLATFWHQEEPRVVFADFEKRHGYVVVWSNDFFEILKATQ